MAGKSKDSEPQAEAPEFEANPNDPFSYTVEERRAADVTLKTDDDPEPEAPAKEAPPS